MTEHREQPGARTATQHGFTALPTGATLERYVIDRVLAAGGFGITYLARHASLDRIVAIKEHFPRQLAYRDGATSEVRPTDPATFKWALDRFLQEGRSLATCKHRNIVDVTDVFEAHGTAYMVLAYEEGQTLKQWLASLGRPPTQAEIDNLMHPLLDALEAVHAKDLLHRDIAPDNIMIRPDGKPCLIDFGSARFKIAEQSNLLSVIIKTGYSPPEQYAASGRAQGPWSDIYALGATLYHAVTGMAPPEAPDRTEVAYVPAAQACQKPELYRPGFLTAIDQALSLRTKERPQSIADWRRALFATEAAPPLPDPVPPDPPIPPVPVPVPVPPPPRPRWLVPAVAASLIALLIAGLTLLPRSAPPKEIELAKKTAEENERLRGENKRLADGRAADEQRLAQARGEAEKQASAAKRLEDERRQSEALRQKTAAEAEAQRQKDSRDADARRQREAQEADARRRADEQKAAEARRLVSRVNLAITGQDIETIRDTTLDACVARCQGDTRCLAYSFDLWNNWCFLKSESKLGLTDPKYHSGYRVTSAPTTSSAQLQFQRYRGRAFPSGGEPTVRAETTEACEARCDGDAKCLAYTFVTSSKQCRLMERTRGAYAPETGTDSGVKRQAGDGG